LRAADILALNTAYEGFSHLLLEALALETPIITTSVGGNGEIIENGKNGVLVPYNNVTALSDAIKKLSKSKTERQKLARAGKETVQLYTASRIISKLIETLRV
jgi:glycosyltransferase involved in cell wall biosynthesis